MPSSGVNWFAEDVILRVGRASQDMLETLALEVEREAVARAAEDTGFMKRSSYIDGEDISTFNSRSDTLTSPKTGQTRLYETVGSPPTRGDNEITVGMAADYAIYVEVEQPALYPALVLVAGNAKGVIETVGKKHFP